MVIEQNKKEKKKKLFYTVCVIVLLCAVVKISIDTVNRFAADSFKRLYGTYTKALNMTAYEMDGDIACYFSAEKNKAGNYSGCKDFYKKFVSNLKVSKYCESNGKKNGCVPNYKKYSNLSECSGYSKQMMELFNQSFVMSDQTNIIVFNMPQDSPKPLFAVDSNGNMPPNRTGYDLFSFVIMRGANGEYYFHPNVVYCLPPEKGGIQKFEDAY
ncbi:hypothetical protein J6P92_06350 [bacterium]|nr:hypothetical protein [bacterium]